MEEAMAAEYRVSAKEWRAREKVEELQREFQRKKLAKEYEDWKSSRPEPPPNIQKISYPLTDLSYSSNQTSNQTSNRVMDEINQLHAQLLRTGAGGDIGGTWRIFCPDINGWHGEVDSMDRNKDVIWIIHPPQTSESFLWAQIDQVIVEGIARIEWPDPVNWNGVSVPFVWRGKTRARGRFSFRIASIAAPLHLRPRMNVWGISLLSLAALSTSLVERWRGIYLREQKVFKSARRNFRDIIRRGGIGNVLRGGAVAETTSPRTKRRKKSGRIPGLERISGSSRRL
jgi:hypothetical protein